MLRWYFIIIPFLFVHAIRGQTTNADCKNNSDTSWVSTTPRRPSLEYSHIHLCPSQSWNSLGQSPCIMAAYIQGACQPDGSECSSLWRLRRSIDGLPARKNSWYRLFRTPLSTTPAPPQTPRTSALVARSRTHCSVRVVSVKDQLGPSTYQPSSMALQTYLQSTPQMVPMDEELPSGGHPQRQVRQCPDDDAPCTEYTLSFPHGIPTGTAIPDWAFIPIDGFVSSMVIFIQHRA